MEPRLLSALYMLLLSCTFLAMFNAYLCTLCSEVCCHGLALLCLFEFSGCIPFLVVSCKQCSYVHCNIIAFLLIKTKWFFKMDSVSLNWDRINVIMLDILFLMIILVPILCSYWPYLISYIFFTQPYVDLSWRCCYVKGCGSRDGRWRWLEVMETVDKWLANFVIIQQWCMVM